MNYSAFTLPAPISKNDLWRPTWRTVRSKTRLPGGLKAPPRRVPGMAKTLQYEAWIKEAGWRLLMQRPAKIAGPYALTIQVSRDSGIDLGNAESAVSDLLQRHHIIENDRLAQKIESTWIAAGLLPAGDGMSVMVVSCKGE